MGEPSGLHVGLIGVGRIGVHHAATLAELDGVARLTLADADTARAHGAAEAELESQTATYEVRRAARGHQADDGRRSA